MNVPKRLDSWQEFFVASFSRAVLSASAMESLAPSVSEPRCETTNQTLEQPIQVKLQKLLVSLLLEFCFVFIK